MEAEKLDLPLKNEWLVEELPEENGTVLVVHAYGFG